jgi:KUP system potassium uptake protein
MAPDSTSPSTITDAAAPHSHSKASAALIVGALGVVFGDIGTSPLYALR